MGLIAWINMKAKLKILTQPVIRDGGGIFFFHLKITILKIEQLFYIWSPLQMQKFTELGQKFLRTLDSEFSVQESKYAQTSKCYNCFSYRVSGEKQGFEICIFTLHINNYISKLSVSCYLYRFRKAYLHHLGLSHLHHVSP